jgi:hypothetical protein
MARVHQLFRAHKRRLPMQPIGSIEAIADFGFSGCKHARKGGKRQVLLVDKETLDAMSLAAGIIARTSLPKA